MSEATASKYLVMTREFDAPPELVWKCWTEPEHMQAWFGPHNFDLPICKIDLRVGGKSFFMMRGLEGEFKGAEIYCGGVYKEIVPNKRLVTTDYFADKEGNEVPASNYGMEGWPEQGVDIIVELEPHNGGTRMTVTQTLPLELAQKMGADKGWGESFEKLAAYLNEMA